MNNLPNQESVIAKFARENLSPTDTQRKAISRRYGELQGFLSGACFMAGSYARFTAVRPPKDLDVIWVAPDANVETHPEQVLRSLAGRLESLYKSNSTEAVRIELQEHSITVVFLGDPDDFSIDVVPAIEYRKLNEFGDPIYCVPEIQKMGHVHRKSFSGHANWILSDPRGYISAATNLDRATSGNFRKTAKIVKAWRQAKKSEHGDNFKLKSFHVEQLVTRHFSVQSDHSILFALQSVFKELNLAIQVPQIRDRADESVFIDQYVADLTGSERAKILTLQGEAFELLSLIRSADSDNKIVDYLEQLTRGVKRHDYVAPAVVISRPSQPYGRTQ